MIDPSKLSAYLDQQDAEQARAAAVAAPNVAPAQMGRALTLAQQTGAPPLAVADALPDFEAQAHRDDVAAAASTSPAFARWHADPVHAAVAQGEASKLGLLSSTLETFNNLRGGYIKPLADAIGRGLARARLGASFQQSDASMLASTGQVVSEALDTPRQALEGVLRPLGLDYGDPLGTHAAVDATTFAAKEASADLQQTMTAVGARPKARDLLTNPLGALEQGVAYYGTRQAASAPALAFLLGTRDPHAAALLMGAPQGAQTYTDLRAQGVDARTAAAAGLGTGAAEVLGEELGLEGLLKRPLRNAVTRGLAVEAGQEAATQAAQDEIEAQATGKPLTLSERLGNMFDAGALGATTGGAISGARAAFGLADLAGSAHGAQQVERVVQQVQDTGAAKHAPQALAALAKEAAPDANVYLSAEQARTLFQSERASADAFVGDLTGDHNALREAEASGGDIVIPLSTFVAKVATLPNAADIAKHVRLAADHLSRAELEDEPTVRAKMEEMAALYGDTADAAKRAKPEGAQADTSDKVTQDVLGMLLATDRYSAADAEVMAKLYGRRFARLAQQTGQDAFDLYSRYQLRINGRGGQQRQGRPNTLDPRTDALLTAARTGAIPEGRDLFGPSLVSALVAQGGVQDPGGDLRSFDALKQRPGLISQHGMPLDAAREWAVEAGYLRDHGAEQGGASTSDINDLLDAIDSELRGNPTFSEQNADPKAQAFANEARDLQRAIDEHPTLRDMPAADVQALSNQELHDLLFAPEAEPSLLQRAAGAVRGLFQSPASTIDLTPGGGSREVKIGDTTIDYGVSRDGTTAEVVLVRTPKASRGQGSARAALTAFLRETDAAGLAVFLTPEPMDKGTTKGGLEEFYRSLGFRPNKGRTRDFRSRQSMVRPAPTELHQSAVPPEDEIARLRAKVAELEKELRTDALTGMRNQRAFDEDAALGWPTVGAADMDGLKRLNDAIGHEAADAVLRTLGGVLLASEGEGVRFYRRSGDEFAARFQNPDDAERIMAALQQRLESVAIDLDVADDAGKVRHLTYEGIGLSYGTGTDYERADAAASINKRDRLAAGIREEARADGQPRRLHERGPAGRQGGEGDGSGPNPAGQVNDETPPTGGVSASGDLHQPDGAGAPRGRLQIGANRAMRVDLFRGADLSTFLHESGHFFLEVMQDAAAASPEVAADLDRVRAWVGNDGGAFTEDQHEQFARGFEAYLREGKAPAPELRGMFGRFRAWLSSVYRDLRQLNVTLTDEVRGVFDRMLATDAEIEAAQAKQGVQPITLADEARGLLKPGQWEAYLAATQDATEEARAEVLQKLLAAHAREAKAWWREQQAAVRAEVEAEFEAVPAVRAWRILSGRQSVDGGAVPEHLQGLRLDRQALVDAYGDAWVKEKLLKLGVYRKEGGVHPDTAAAALGFPSGDALVKALAEVRDLQARIGQEVDDRMHARHPDPALDGSLPDLAMRSVHNNARVKALEAEQAILATLANQPVPPARLVREYARRKVAELTVRAVRPNDYLAAERRAAAAVAKAAAQGDYAEALQHKRAQALQAALYREARDAQDRAESQVAALRKLAGDKARDRIGKAGKDYLDALDELLEGHELRPVSGAEVRRRAALRAWVESQQGEDELGVTNVDEGLLARVESERVTNVLDLTVQQLADLHAAAQNIAHLARLKNKLLKGKDARDWDEAKGELLDRMRAVLDQGKPPPLSTADLSLLERMGQGYTGFMDWMLRPETVVEWLDGGESGPWHDYFWQQMEAGEAERNRLRRMVAEPLVKMMAELPAAERRGLDSVVHIDSLGRSMSRGTILSVLLNLGNASNRDKLMRGGLMVDGEVVPFRPEQVADMLRELTAAQAKLAQKIWDAIEGLWPEIVRQQEKLAGYAPEKIEATPVTFTTKDGQQVTLAGGYYPAAYDPRAGQGGARQAADADKLLDGSFTPAFTSKGHTKERNGYAAPMLLDYQAVLSRHLNNVITDLAYRQPLRQMLRILNDSTIKGVIHQRLSRGAYHALLGSVKATIQGTNGMSEPSAEFFENVKAGVVRNTVVAALGLKVGLLVANTVTAPVLALARVKTRYVAEGLGRYYRHPAKLTAMIHELSPFMLDRAENAAAGYEDVLAELRGKHGVRARIAEASLALHHTINPLVERGLWLGRYMQAQAEGADISEAVRLADKAIRQTQTQAAPKDLSAVERSPSMKVFNLFLGPMIIANNRLQEAGLRGKLRGAVETPAQALGVWFAMVVANGALFELLSGRGPDDDDDDGLDWKDWSGWLARKALLFPFQTMPLVRNAANAIDQVFEEHNASARPDPLTEAMGLMVKFGKSANDHALDAWQGDEHAQARLAKDTAGAAGVAFGLPTQQAMTTGSYLYDLSTGQAQLQSPLDARYFIYKRPK